MAKITKESWDQVVQKAREVEASGTVTVSKDDILALLEAVALEVAKVYGASDDEFKKQYLVKFDYHCAPFPDEARFGELCCVYSVGVEKIS